MDALRKLDQAVSRLLARTEALSGENMRLREELATRMQALADMQQEVAGLRNALNDEAKLRMEAYEKLKALVEHINKYTCLR